VIEVDFGVLLSEGVNDGFWCAELGVSIDSNVAILSNNRW
jgi:hypothetical protein